MFVSRVLQRLLLRADHNPVHIELDDAVGQNVLTRAVLEQFASCIHNATTDSDVRVVLVSAAGPSFSIGFDLDELMAVTAGSSSPATGIVTGPATVRPDPARVMFQTRDVILHLQDCISAVEQCTKPVIGVVHGYVYGAGIDLISAMDIRFCAETTRFCVKEVDVGLAADLGTLQRFPRCVGNQSWARELIYTARQFGSAEAFANGFVSGVFASREQAISKGVDLATIIGRKSPVAVQGSKHLLNYSADHCVQDGRQRLPSANPC